MPYRWDMTPPVAPQPDEASNLIPTWTMGDRLRRARRTAGLQANELAAKIGVHHNTISNYENDRGNVDRRTVIAWAWATGVPLEWLETGEIDRRQVEKPFRGRDRRSAAGGRNSPWSHNQGESTQPGPLMVSPRYLPATGIATPHANTSDLVGHLSAAR